VAIPHHPKTLPLNPRIFLLLALWGWFGPAAGQSVIADFGSDIQQGCSPMVVNFSDRSTGNPVAWQWDFGNGSTSTLRNPSATFFTIGSYTVQLTVTDASGATHTVTKQNFITVLNPPRPDFSANSTEGCAPSTFQFLDASQSPGNTTVTSWSWDFGDGQTATGSAPTHVYRAAGTYTVTLSVTNSAGCQALFSKPNYINISPGVTPRFQASEPTVCQAPVNVVFTNSSAGSGTLSYNWNFGDGRTSAETNPVHSYNSNGDYRVVLEVTSSLGCSDTTSRLVSIGRISTDFLVPERICPGMPADFRNNSSPRPVSSQWTFSNGQTDSLPHAQATVEAPGTYTVQLINFYSNCADSVTKTINVAPTPVASFSVSDSTRCQPTLNATFQHPAENGVTYTWDYGDGTTGTGANPTHGYNRYGTFSVTLIASDASGCNDTLTRPNLITIQRPLISFVGLPWQGCAPDTVPFKADVRTSGSVTSWSWNFGDGSPNSNLDSTSHIYPQTGTYPVSLTITTNEGCTETATLPAGVRLGPAPVPDFTATPLSACADPGITFTNLSSNALTYNWDFGDGTNSSETNPVHVFADTGRFTITLTAINNGCRENLVKTFYVTIGGSVSRFSWRPDCNNPLRYTFTDESVGARTWRWDFGDGTTFVGRTPPAHTFPRFGTYRIRLTTTSDSCSYTLEQELVIADQRPSFRATDSVGCRPFTTTFNIQNASFGYFQDFHWDFGDGSGIDSLQGPSATYTYPNPGNYSVRLIAIDTFGCRHEVVRSNYMKVNGPIAAFGALNPRGCAGRTVTFTDSSRSDGRNPIRQWIWDFGDTTGRQTFAAPPFTHTYNNVGDYSVKLIVVDSAGCRDSLERRAFIRTSRVKADFSAQREFCPRSNLTIANLTESELPVSSVWNFGNGRTANTFNGITSYTDTGYYSVTLWVEDIMGCRDSLRRDSFIQIKRPQADFTANNFTTYCTTFQARFTNTSYFYHSAAWDFGPGMGTSNQRNPYAFYTTPGTYPVRLIITAFGGCRDTVIKTMNIRDESEARLTYTPNNGCTPLSVNFNAFAPMNARFVWDFGDGPVVDTTLNEMQHLYTSFGNFRPRIIMRELSGQCTMAITGAEIIRLRGVKARFDLDTMLFCDGGTIRANSDSTTSNDPIVGYNWTFGDGGTSTAAYPSHTYTQTGQYDVRLVVRTQSGCTDSMVQTPVRVVASPQFRVVGDSIVCREARVPFRAELAQSDTSEVRWNWTFPNGNSASQQQPPDQVFTTPGRYEMLVTSSNSSGCTDTVRRSLLVRDIPTIRLAEQLTKYVGVPALLQAEYSQGIRSCNWQPASDLNCSDCPQPITTTSFTTTYTVTATDSNGCRQQARIRVIVLCQGARVFVANTFSPNGDGANDVLYVQGKGLSRVKSLRIFNRWGEMVYERRDLAVNDPSSGWDGTFRGQKAAPDVYIYQLEVFCDNGEVLRFDGNVALIR